jgi:mono/diheme cytochrome c family protein
MASNMTLMPICKFSVLALLLFAASALSAAAQDTAKGRQEYLRSCAQCHGNDGGGRGPMSSQIKMKMGDLRTLARKNRGVYSPEAVYQEIDGRNPSSRHTKSEMPIWGCRQEPASGATAKKRGRIAEIWNKMKEDRRVKAKKRRKNKSKRVKDERPDAFLDLPCDSEAAIKARIQSVVDYLAKIQMK